jgi:hypothetical protein
MIAAEQCDILFAGSEITTPSSTLNGKRAFGAFAAADKVKQLTARIRIKRFISISWLVVNLLSLL